MRRSALRCLKEGLVSYWNWKLTFNELIFLSSDSIPYAKVIVEVKFDSVKVDLNVERLFANIPLEKTVEKCDSNLFSY